MVERLDRKRGAYLKTSARVQLSATNQRQHIFDYCTVDGVNDKKQYKTSFTRPPNVDPTYPALESQGDGKFCVATSQTNLVAGLHMRRCTYLDTSARSPLRAACQRHRYAQRANDNAFCDAVRSNVKMKNKKLK